MRRMILCSLVLAVAASPAVVLSQSAPRPAGILPQAHAGFEAMRAREADDLALVLGLTSAQRPALDAFLTPARPPRPPRPDDMDGPAEGFAAHLAARERHVTAMGDAERRDIAAARAFYAQLDPHQRQVFEAVMRMRHGPGGPGGHGPDHGPDHGLGDGPGRGGPHGGPGGHGGDDQG